MRPLSARLIAISAITVLGFVFEVSSISAQQVHGPDCMQDRVRCAYQTALNVMTAAYSKQAVSDQDKQAQTDALRTLIAPENEPDRFVFALTGDSLDDQLLNNLLDAWQRARVDRQSGSTSASNGTTDLVSRPSTSDLLGLAVQLGAMTETVSGSTATFQANAGGTYRAILGQPAVCVSCAPSGPFSINNLNLSVSFDLTSQAAQTVATSGSANPSTPAVPMVVLPESSRQFSQLDVRYNILNPIDPRSTQFQKAWKDSYDRHKLDLVSAANDLNKQLGAILNPLIKDPKLDDLQSKYSSQITSAAAGGEEKLYSVFRAFFNELVNLARADVPNLDQKVSGAVASFARYSQLNSTAVAEAAGTQFTFEYTFNHPRSIPDTHDFRLIWGFTPSKALSGSLFTINLAGSIYAGQLPTGASYGRMRDFQIAAQFDRPLGDRITHAATLSLAGYAQYQFDPSVLNIGAGNLAPGTNIVLPKNAQVLLGTKGTLAVVQAMITIDLKSGLKIPIGVSWANKTDLLNASDVRGHIGLTYNFDSLGQLIGR